MLGLIATGITETVRGCLKEEARMDVISHNLANAASVGFKKNTISFQNVLSAVQTDTQSSQQVDAAEADTNLVLIETDFTQGNMKTTGRTLDLAIFGEGFFKVNTPDGVRYTRKGSFILDGEGYLTTGQGYAVLGKSGPINIRGERIEVDELGRVLIAATETDDLSEIDQLDVVNVANPQQMIKESGLLFAPTDKTEEVPLDSRTVIRQGYLEGSNVNIAEEMVKMIHCVRAFESYQKAIKVLDTVDQKANNDVGRLR
jgi:flagellar basal-body rod protein FlgG